jgi:hypothetical protein
MITNSANYRSGQTWRQGIEDGQNKERVRFVRSMEEDDEEEGEE